MSTSNNARFNTCDEDVYFRVCSFLHSRHFPAFRHLGVTVERGIVTLSGRVCSFYEKQVAITSCQHVAGVSSLIDCIVVSDHPAEVAPVEERIAIVNE